MLRELILLIKEFLIKHKYFYSIYDSFLFMITTESLREQMDIFK